MKQFFSLALIILLIASPVSVVCQQKGKTSGSKQTARFIVQVTFDDEYQSVTDKPNEIDAQRPHDSGKATSKLHMELQASRWIKIQPGDGGATEFLALNGGEPSSVTGSVSISATDESRSDNGTGDKNRVVSENNKTTNFTGKIASSTIARDDSAVFLGVPQFSELGDGLEFRLKLKIPMKGACGWKSVDESGTKTFDDCSSASAAVAEGFQLGDENRETGKTAETAYLAEFDEDFTIYPALNAEQQKLQSEAEREKVPGVWIGASTRGDRQAGYKMNLTKTKTILTDQQDGITREEKQKITVNAEIVPGAPTVSFNLDNDYQTTDLLLTEIAEEKFGFSSALQ